MTKWVRKYRGPKIRKGEIFGPAENKGRIGVRLNTHQRGKTKEGKKRAGGGSTWGRRENGEISQTERNAGEVGIRPISKGGRKIGGKKLGGPGGAQEHWKGERGKSGDHLP